MLVTSAKSNISFGRALNSKELRQFSDVREKAKKAAGQTGKSIFIVHDTCLPQSACKNTGVSSLSSQDTLDFLAYMKPYLGFNTLEILPAGELKNENGFYCAYAGSSLSLGNHQINPELLTKKDFGEILTQEEYDSIVKSNMIAEKDSLVNYPNVVDKNSAQESALRKAFARFQTLGDDTKIKQDFKRFVSENNDWLEPKAIYQILSDENSGLDFTCWSEIDRRLYDSTFSAETRAKRITEILNTNPNEADFYKFKQFLADEHLAIGRKNLNNLGVKLTGDCPIGFSRDEIWAYPDAFSKEYQIGDLDWYATALNYETIKDPQSSSAQLLKRKVQLHAKRYDGIRFDVGWAYVVPKLNRADGTSSIKYLGDDVLSFIENAVKEIKGEDYDLKNLIYEFQGGEIFSGTSLIPPVQKRVGIFDSVYMKDTQYELWGSNNALERRGFRPYVMGVGNHDAQPLRQIANGVPDIQIDGEVHKTNALDALAKILKLDKKSLENPVQFAKAKWAEPMMAENNMMFYMDVFGREERFNMHGENRIVHPWKNFAYKIPANYQEAYHRAIQEGYGFNIMDSLEKVFAAKGLDKTQPELYSEIVKFRNILNEDGFAPIVKSNKYIKPLVIAAIVTCAAALAISKIFIKNKKQTDNNTMQNTPAQNTTPAPQNPTLNLQNMNDFLNKTKSNIS